MDNMQIYNLVRVVPKEAQKTIRGGRLSGFTDINAMWRIQKLTETFGPCGIGWKYTIEREWLEQGANGEIAAFMDILLYYKHDGEWSDGIPGTGGSSFVAKERNGLYTSDECYKMALTDAISVAAKAIGMGADIYWDKGRTKYDAPPERQEPEKKTDILLPCARCGADLFPVTKRDGTPWAVEDMAKYSSRRYGQVLCAACMKAIEKEEKDANKQGKVAAGQ